MAQRSLFWPVSIIVVCCLLFVVPLMFSDSAAAPLAQATATACSGQPGDAAYDTCKAIEDEECARITSTAGYPTCRTALAPVFASKTAARAQTDGTAPATNTSTSTATNTAQAQQQPQSTATSTTTATRTLTPTVRTATATTNAAPTNTTPTISAGQTAAPTEIEAGVTATPLIQGEPCIPGEVFTLTGDAPPDTPLIVTFDPLAGEGTPTPTSSRTVAGGRSDGNGRYRIALLMGDEKAGTYEVRVRVRSTREVLNVSLCTVPAATPTATLGN
jgi:hypothetical protein